MTEASTHPARSLKQALSERLPKRRDESGLTTLEWLLIVAAVAGLAALAVVLVTNVVSDTSEDIEGQRARATAAELAADQISRDAVDARSTTANNSADVNAEYEPKCDRLELLYGDVDGLTITWTDGVQNAAFAWTTDPDCDAST